VYGHRQIRLQTGWQHDDDNDFLIVGGRAAYHDFHDPLNAYQKGTQLEVFDAVMRIGMNNPQEDTAIQLDHMRWFSLRSYSARDNFFQPTSWGFSVSRSRERIDKHNPLLHVIDGYRGVGFDCAALLCHGEIIGGMLGGSALEQGWSARVGARAGVLYQSNLWSASFDVSEQTYIANDYANLSVVEAGIGYPLARNTALFGGYRYEGNNSASHNSFTFSLRQFF
jgi:hypothetical protein